MVVTGVNKNDLVEAAVGGRAVKNERQVERND